MTTVRPLGADALEVVQQLSGEAFGRALGDHARWDHLLRGRSVHVRDDF